MRPTPKCWTRLCSSIVSWSCWIGVTSTMDPLACVYRRNGAAVFTIGCSAMSRPSSAPTHRSYAARHAMFWTIRICGTGCVRSKTAQRTMVIYGIISLPCPPRNGQRLTSRRLVGSIERRLRDQSSALAI
uniref:Putative secreted protein n=1 Tax=Anopheles darlingi TaxID=43151 RepID=A0A2M4DJ99_ANODA